MAKLTHVSEDGAAHMVDITDKQATRRQASAQAVLTTAVNVVELLERAAEKKGDVFATARIAGIMAAKKTSDLIPLCHPLPLNKVTIDIAPKPQQGQIHVLATCVTEGKTGIEMEALTAASVAALTLYDMAKAVDPAMVIGGIQLVEKIGGKSGHWRSANQETQE
ncbi:cyclic pyranopterin monophosphate synthase MoaC [Aliidiomarina celeris]|uniref:cyclic pyranopterin monophosphate synthase MoaC n=1 Tax=Aliidiomarina celeris TaxID=2249428 RepID=UPI000DEB4ECB|nr:cyclic pyranopterin monophosphate synthase MoaC [Aliidiomarina celeris]